MRFPNVLIESFPNPVIAVGMTPFLPETEEYKRQQTSGQRVQQNLDNTVFIGGGSEYPIKKTTQLPAAIKKDKCRGNERNQISQEKTD